MRTLYFDCFCGASGDMIVGALIDAGVPFDDLRAGLDALRVPGFTVTAEKVNKRGIMAMQFRVIVEHDHGTGHSHPDRHLEDILDILAEAELPEPVAAASAETFRRIAQCEAAVHGQSVDTVHFHEVGAIDSIVDIVGTHLALHMLRIDQVIASPLNLGSGTIETAHGALPVPAPATVMLLKGVPCYASAVQAELVTPTGAALLSQRAASFGSMPQMRIETIGYGAGTRDLPDRPNVLRAMIGETKDALPGAEPITVIEANIDDMNPELLPPLIADLIANGARDAFFAPILGKKGRPGFLVTVLCDEDKAGQVVPRLFYGSTTFGVRMRTDRRICLDREWRAVKTPWGVVQVKMGRFAGEITCVAPEFEECRRLAEEKGITVVAVYEWAHAAAVKGEFVNA